MDPGALPCDSINACTFSLKYQLSALDDSKWPWKLQGQCYILLAKRFRIRLLPFIFSFHHREWHSRRPDPMKETLHWAGVLGHPFNRSSSRPLNFFPCGASFFYWVKAAFRVKNSWERIIGGQTRPRNTCIGLVFLEIILISSVQDKYFFYW